MSETIYSNSGLGRITPRAWPMRWRWVTVSLFVLVGVLLITWIKTSTWRQVAKLQQEFKAIQAENFSLAGQIRGAVGRMNAALLRFQLFNEAEERTAFSNEVAQIKGWFDKAQTYLMTEEEEAQATLTQTAFQQYLRDTAPLLQSGLAVLDRPSGTAVQRDIMQKSAPLMRACDELLKAQQGALVKFLDSSRQHLTALQHFSQISLLLLLALILASAGLIYRVLSAVLQVKLTETQTVIERQEKLASLGILATGVAHEIRNPLTAIKFRLFSLKKALSPALLENEDLGVIDNEINRLERIVKDFLQFARPSEPDMVHVPVQKIFAGVKELLQPQLEKQEIALCVEAAEDLWVQVDKQQIEQVLINLIQNSADSIGRKGTITLRAYARMESLNHKPTPSVALEVADTGKGIPPEIQRRIFDPFFSTKEGGTGLGLSIAARILEKHGGILRYESQPRKGVTFRLVLPSPAEHESKNSPR